MLDCYAVGLNLFLFILGIGGHWWVGGVRVSKREGCGR